MKNELYWDGNTWQIFNIKQISEEDATSVAYLLDACTMVYFQRVNNILSLTGKFPYSIVEEVCGGRIYFGSKSFEEFKKGLGKLNFLPDKDITSITKIGILSGSVSTTWSSGEEEIAHYSKIYNIEAVSDNLRHMREYDVVSLTVLDILIRYIFIHPEDLFWVQIIFNSMKNRMKGFNDKYGKINLINEYLNKVIDYLINN